MPKENKNSTENPKPQKPVSHVDIPRPQSIYIQNGRNLDGIIRRKSKE